MTSRTSTEKARGLALTGLEARQEDTADARRPQADPVDVSHSDRVLEAPTDARLVLVKESQRRLEQLQVPKRNAKEV